MMGDKYAEFLKAKDHADDQYGFEPLWLPDCQFPFQQKVDDWAIRKGRAAILAGCGLGKSNMELVWGENIVRKTNKPVLLLTPLAVGPQMVKEGEKFGVPCKQTRKGKVYKGINVTNYERISYFDPKDFSACIMDESSGLKAVDSQRRRQITDFMSKVKYRLLASATPCPNDFMELGNSSEALGNMTRGQMLGMFFTNGGETTQQWELKGHARKRFWRWVCSWARAIRQPSDLGFPDDGFVLPQLTLKEHKAKYEHKGSGFGLAGAKTLSEQRQLQARTVRERCELVASLVPKNDYFVAWCHRNDEGDLLEEMIPGAVQVAGKNSDEEKEERLAAFANGEIKHLITKPKIGGFGLNLQHCNQLSYFPNHSFEMWHQVVRRFWRFRQERPVTAHIVSSAGESAVRNNMLRKERQMEAMFAGLVESLSEYQMGRKKEEPKINMELPAWAV